MRNVSNVTQGGTFRDADRRDPSDAAGQAGIVKLRRNRLARRSGRLLCVRRVALLLLMSGFIGLRIMSLQERLETLGALAELHLHKNE